ncbi:MAG TPA: fructosamine kinase family protein [Baekduia sp.]|nr:fructosamine kinase family protein [Baekduia sp.]
MREALAAALGEDVVGLEPVPGGDLNAAYRATLAGGARVFVKTSADAAPGAYAAEAAGLRWLGAADALPVPEVLAVDDRWLALAWVDGGGRLDEAALGRGLAVVHRAGAERFGTLPIGSGRGEGMSADGSGADAPYVLGPLVLPNAPRAEWPAFYAESRLLPLARMAADRGALDAGGVRAVESVAAKIEELAGPAEPPARLHGDLWSGNVHAGADGRPWLIDPAAYGGHREIDLAMLSLFGSPSSAFGAAYDEVWPRADGHAERVALYQLLPLLVHAVLFGGGYGASARLAAERFV